MPNSSPTQDVINNGGVVAFPTDTVYGLGCDPRNIDAVERIYALKNRPDDLELNILAADANALDELVTFNNVASALANQFWPGPLSLVLPVGRQRLAIPRHGDTLMVRVPGHDAARDLLAQTGPLASTSANRHGQPPATTAAEVTEQLGADVDLVIEGHSGGGLASTIIDCSQYPPRLLREGPISADELRTYWEVSND
jgi:tRNA threonylcarbamoyl adenosine modification protein (Sua5/YciO/YrdC/YwlC family)